MKNREETRRFYITTPIFYPNARPHMGHAYTTVLCDCLKRYHALSGDETYLLTGVDENTEKVVRAAKAAGRETQEYLDSIVSGFKDLFSAEKLNISYDQFIRTSDKAAHWPGAEELWRRLVKAGDIEKRSYEGLYCVGHEAFMTEKELVGGLCPEHGEAPQVLKEENYFFKLSRYTEKIKEKIESDELKVIPETRKNEIMALLERGLEDVSFSRPADKVSVGIPVPDDPTQKMYVWCDALSNYITALGFGRQDRSLYEKFWPADVHVIGKDILRFHAAIWPGMLLSAGLPLPKKLLVHGFLTSGGRKMSKTLGNVIDPNDLIKEYGAEAVRYYLLRHISPFEDGDVTLEKFKEVYNADLANGLGNLVSRVMKMAEKHLPNSVTCSGWINEPEFSDLEECNVQKTVESAWEYIGHVDALIQMEEPFKKVKEDKKKGTELIIALVQKLNTVANLLLPIMPQTAEHIKKLITENKMPEKPLFPRED